MVLSPVFELKIRAFHFVSFFDVIARTPLKKTSDEVTSATIENPIATEADRSTVNNRLAVTDKPIATSAERSITVVLVAVTERPMATAASRRWCNLAVTLNPIATAASLRW